MKFNTHCSICKQPFKEEDEINILNNGTNFVHKTCDMDQEKIEEELTEKALIKIIGEEAVTYLKNNWGICINNNLLPDLKKAIKKEYLAIVLPIHPRYGGEDLLVYSANNISKLEKTIIHELSISYEGYSPTLILFMHKGKRLDAIIDYKIIIA